MVVDDVSKVTVLLKNGEADYALLYRSSCIANDIRYIELGEKIDLSSSSNDYSRALVEFEKLKSGIPEKVTVNGEQAVWALSIPEKGSDKQAGMKFVDYLLNKKSETLRNNGFNVILPAKESGL